MAKTQPNIDDIKGLTQWINFLWLKLKDLFSAESETTNDNYLPKIDDVNKKLIKSNISDDGTTPKYGANKIWHSGNDGSTSGLDADLLDDKHASDFASVDHNHDYGDLGDMPVATDTEVGGIKLLFTPGNSGIIPIQLVESKAYIELLADNIRYAIGNDTVINGKKYWLKNKTIIIPDGNVGVPSDYNEGLRIANSPNGYSLIALGAGDNTTSGLNSDGKQWNIIKHPNGELTISFDSGFVDNPTNSNRTGLTLYKNGDIYWKNAKLNLPRVSPLISGWLHNDDFRRFDRVADHAQITLTSKELLFDAKQTNIGGDEIFGNDSPEFDDSGLYDSSGSYNLVEGRRYEVIINMGMHSSMVGGLTLNLVKDGAVIKSTSTTANEGYLSMSLSCIVDGGNSISVSIQKDAGIGLSLLHNQCWFAVHEIK